MCEGVTAVGSCEHTPKYVIRAGSRNHTRTVLVRGVHLAQIIKTHLRGGYSSVEVARADV